MGHWLGSVVKPSHGVTLNLGPAKLCSPAIIETYLSYDKDIWIAVTNYCMYFYLIVPFLVVARLQFINFKASYFTDIFSPLNVNFSFNITWTLT